MNNLYGKKTRAPLKPTSAKSVRIKRINNRFNPEKKDFMPKVIVRKKLDKNLK